MKNQENQINKKYFYINNLPTRLVSENGDMSRIIFLRELNRKESIYNDETFLLSYPVTDYDDLSKIKAEKATDIAKYINSVGIDSVKVDDDIEYILVTIGNDYQGLQGGPILVRIKPYDILMASFLSSDDLQNKKADIKQIIKENHEKMASIYAGGVSNNAIVAYGKDFEYSANLSDSLNKYLKCVTLGFSKKLEEPKSKSKLVPTNISLEKEVSKFEKIDKILTEASLKIQKEYNADNERNI